jgi:hypothetical protein
MAPMTRISTADSAQSTSAIRWNLSPRRSSTRVITIPTIP